MAFFVVRLGLLALVAVRRVVFVDFLADDVLLALTAGFFILAAFGVLFVLWLLVAGFLAINSPLPNNSIIPVQATFQIIFRTYLKTLLII
jgi:hypothetical protein